MRLVVTGRDGQVARALQEAASGSGIEMIALGRPQLDLARTGSIETALMAARPDVIVNAGAWTMVDAAEADEEAATLINGAGAGAVAAVAKRLEVPVIHLSTDYVFDGTKSMPYVECDPVGPVSAYGRSKLAGELAVMAATDNHLVLRTSWVFSPWGRNFVLTMLKLAETRPELRVVSDQIGNPTYAPDLAVGIVQAAKLMLAAPANAELRGIFHLSGTGETSWAELARALFALSRNRGQPTSTVIPIGTVDYPTPARRPANSRLDCSKFARQFSYTMPHWQVGLSRCLDAVSAHTEKD